MRANQKGFTLIEVICSVALLAIIITASSSFFSGVVASQKGSKQLLYANNIAQEVMEESTRSGDTTSKTYTKDGYKYYVEIKADENADVAFSGQDPNDPNATPNPSETPYALKIKPSAPPQGTTVPGEEGEDEILNDGEPPEHNMHIDFFDYIDEDLPMLIAAGEVLSSYNTVFDDKLDIKTKLAGSTLFSSYTAGESAGGVASNLEKASVCYRYLTPLQRSSLLNTFKSSLDKVTTVFDNNVPSYTTFSGMMWDWSGMDDAAKAEAAQDMYNYIRNSDNIARTLTKTYEKYQEIKDSLAYGETITGTGIEFLDGKPQHIIDRLMMYYLGNAYNQINGTTYRSGTGPLLVTKLLDNNNNCMSFGVTSFTHLVDDYSGVDYYYDGNNVKHTETDPIKAAIRFQLYGHYLNCYTFSADSMSFDSSNPNYDYMSSSGGTLAWKWSENQTLTTDEPSVTNPPLGVKLVNLPQHKTGHEDQWYQGNVVNIFTFYVTGGLSYRDTKITADFYKYSGADYFCDPEVEGLMHEYRPGVSYFKNVDYGADRYQFKLCNPDDWANFNDDPTYNPDDNSNPGKEGTETQTGVDRNGVTDEEIITYLNFTKMGTNFYTVTVYENDVNGKVLAVLNSYGIQSASPTPDPDDED